MRVSEGHPVKSGSLSTTHGASFRCGLEERPPVWSVAVNISNNIADTGWSCSMGDGRGADNSSP
jgi:hypothetical protein